VSANVNLLRIVGSFTISELNAVNDNDTQPSVEETSGGLSSTISVSMSSETVSVIRVFVGSSAVSFNSSPVSGILASSSHTPNDRKVAFNSTLFAQECKHLYMNQKFYRVSWKAEHIQSDLSINSPFHMDGTIEQTHLDKYFLLN